ncbi:hypothetical protein Aduo_005705 [Ancylostoma duodenale]
MGLSATALLDTGSETSIIPAQFLKKAAAKGVNLDTYVERLESPPVNIRDASGNTMKLFDTIQVAITVNGKLEFIPFFVAKGLDDVIVLGTNALEAFGIGLSSKERHEPSEDVRGHEEQELHEAALVKERVYVPPGKMSYVTLTRVSAVDEPMLWSAHPLISHGVCRVTPEGEVCVPVLNNTEEPVIFHEKDKVGEWRNESWITPKHVDASNDMLDLNLQKKWQNRQERLEELLRLLQSDATPPKRLKELISKWDDVFAVTDSELTQTTLVVHDIDTGDHKPIKQKTRPIPIGARKEFKEIIKGLLERGIVEPSASEWASPVVLVKKKDGTLRLCIDYGELNKVTKQDSYPLPTIDAVLQSLNGKKIFSTLDMASGYWQIKLSEDAKQKSAFTTSEGLFQFAVLPFGLCTSPAVFQRMMDRVLEELDVKDDEVFVYIDDILIATESVQRHYEIMEKDI